MRNLLFITFLLVASLSRSQELTRILFILDASNSMNAKWNGEETRIQAAKDLLAKTVDSLEGTPNLEIALRVYGHQSPVTNTYQDCNDTKLEVPFGKDNYTKIKYRIKSIEAKGTTPIARSLEASAEDFPDANAKNIIILITDGLEACDNDPCVIAQKLKDKGIRVTPFVIGLGMDLSYLEKFNCIGTFAEAETKASLKIVLRSIIEKVLENTTVQINLNNTYKEPKETDVTMFLYEAGTKNLMYTFTHTINRYGNPDTLVINPKIKYDLVVHTIPQIEKKNISITPNIHNTIILDAPQGYLNIRFRNAVKPYPVVARITLEKDPVTLNVQQMDFTDKYITGKYKVEILTLPRIYKTVDITQSNTTNIDIMAPGNFSYRSNSQFFGQIFLINYDGTLEWVCNLDQEDKVGQLYLQPNNYRVVYRYKHSRSTSYTIEKDFKISSNKTTSLTL